MELANLVEQGGNNYSCTNLSIKMSGSEVYPNIEIHMLYECLVHIGSDCPTPS